MNGKDFTEQNLVEVCTAIVCHSWSLLAINAGIDAEKAKFTPEEAGKIIEGIKEFIWSSQHPEDKHLVPKSFGKGLMMYNKRIDQEVQELRNDLTPEQKKFLRKNG